MPVNIQIRNSDGMSHLLVRKNHIKYLGVMIDDCVSWKYHILYICSQISRNIGIISKLRHYLSIKHLIISKFIQICPGPGCSKPD